MKIIEVEKISKKYFLKDTPKEDTIRDVLLGALRFGKSKDEKILWALKDVSFEVKTGEVIGLIGNNGAGKSTLLKILSRIVKPTSGEATLYGRVGSLLEVGTGFHQELSGRENIYLNGATLGMKQSEIRRKFDEIVAFSEMEKFLDNPIKHYSTGMYMRLAFAIASHLEPEILFVDEVLAVGDIAFQKKCLNKIHDVGVAGRTVIFVSHNLQAVARLCNRVIWLENGKVRGDGEAQEIVAQYLQAQTNIEGEKSWENIENAPGNEFVKLRKVRSTDENGKGGNSFDIRRTIHLEMEYEVLQEGKIITPSFHIYNEEGLCVFVTNDVTSDWRRVPRKKGKYKSCVEIPANFMSEGTFSVFATTFTAAPFEEHFFERDAIGFHIFDSLDGDSARGDFGGLMIGAVRPLLNWETRIEK